MASDFRILIEDSIRLEQTAEKVYNEYARRFPEDTSFWTQLAHEEHCHAEMIKNTLKFFMSGSSFPREMICRSIEALEASNALADEVLEAARSGSLPLDHALALALKLEESAGELHLNKYVCERGMAQPEVFNVLTQCDCEHARRIRNLMKSKGLDAAEILEHLAHPSAF
jgi:rubrerythrin